jgi:hypothetical protein
MEIALVVLSFNEIDGLKHHLPLLPGLCRENGIKKFFAVDGGSKDGSLELYGRYNIPALIQDKKGRGEAFKLAFARSQEEALIFFSPDGNEDIKALANFCRLLQGGADMVIASRMMPGARNEEDDQILRWRKWVNQAFTFLANLLWNRKGPYITDTINGFRAIKRRAWEVLRVSAGDYAVEYQSTIHAFKRKLKIAEFPTIEGQRIGGESNAKSFPTGMRFLKLLASEIVKGKSF